MSRISKIPTRWRPRLHSERRRIAAKTAAGDPVVVDRVPDNLKRMVAVRVRDALNEYQRDAVVRALQSAGVRALHVPQDTYFQTAEAILIESIKRADVDEFLDILEAIVNAVHSVSGFNHAEELAGELQTLMRDEFFGYSFECVTEEESFDCSYQLTESDPAHLRQAVVDRTYELTTKKGFTGAQADYTEARKGLVQGNYSDAMFKAGRALESAQKAALDARQIAYGQANASRLAALLIDNGILPTRLQTMESQLRSMLGQGPTSLRNMPGAGHGSATPISHDKHLATLALNLTASLIIFLAEES